MGPAQCVVKPLISLVNDITVRSTWTWLAGLWGLPAPPEPPCAPAFGRVQVHGTFWRRKFRQRKQQEGTQPAHKILSQLGPTKVNVKVQKLQLQSRDHQGDRGEVAHIASVLVELVEDNHHEDGHNPERDRRPWGARPALVAQVKVVGRAHPANRT